MAQSHEQITLLVLIVKFFVVNMTKYPDICLICISNKTSKPLQYSYHLFLSMLLSYVLS